jgi:quercetin dioxygenase-like cupin family protein
MLVILSGEMEVQVSDGESRRLPCGSIVLTEDVRGKGHKGKVTSSSDVFGISIRLSE